MIDSIKSHAQLNLIILLIKIRSRTNRLNNINNKSFLMHDRQKLMSE